MLSQGAGPAAFLFAIGFAKYLLTHKFLDNINSQLVVEDYQLRVGRIKGLLEQNAKVATSQNIIQGIEQACPNNKILQELAWQAVSLAGLEGKIFVENGKQPNYLVEYRDGYTFAAKPFKFFLDPKHGTWEKDNCKIMVLDGLIEKVSEIDHILQKCFETKQALVIVAQGFSEEVVATLKANQERKNFDCIPVRIMPDIESLNMINDIGVVCGAIPISSLKGELLCFVKFEELPTVENIKCNVKEIAIQNSSTRAAVNSHIRALLEKRNENFEIEDVQNLIDNRLKTMVSSAVIIHLENASSMVIDTTRIQLDNALRSAKTILNYGTVDLDHFLKAKWKPEGGLDFAIEAGLQMINANKKNKELPTLSLVATLFISGKPLLELLGSNGMVYLT